MEQISPHNGKCSLVRVPKIKQIFFFLLPSAISKDRRSWPSKDVYLEHTTHVRGLVGWMGLEAGRVENTF